MAELTFVVSERDTAVALGSGDVEVLGTPRLLAWLEAATLAAAADLAHRDGRLLRFVVAAHDGDDRLLASGTVTRVVVDRERFLARLPG